MESVDLVHDRQRWLLGQLEDHRRIITTEAAERLGVSVDTVRRDLRALHQQGLARRVHGGAVPVPTLAPSFRGRSDEGGPELAAVADAIVDRLRPGQLIGLDAGSTSVEIAGRLPPSLGATVVTNGPAVALALADHPTVEVILLGGTMDLTWMAATGPSVVDGWREVHLDVAVVGVCGFDPTSGATTRSSNEVATKRALAAAAAEVIVPVQAEKLATLAPFHVLDPDQVDVAVVEAAPNRATAVIAAGESAGIEISVVDPNRTS